MPERTFAMETKRTRRVFGPKEKITAVLSIWTEQKKMSHLCRELSISWSMLDQWQNQAMEGMLTALSPKRPEPQKGLTPRLQKLIDKKLTGGNLVKLEQRLKAIQQKTN
jgi:transposase-like protein